MKHKTRHLLTLDPAVVAAVRATGVPLSAAANAALKYVLTNAEPFAPEAPKWMAPDQTPAWSNITQRLQVLVAYGPLDTLE